MRTIEDLKRCVDCLHHTLEVSIMSINMHKDFERLYKNWADFMDDSSIDHLELCERHCLDIHDFILEIWIE